MKRRMNSRDVAMLADYNAKVQKWKQGLIETIIQVPCEKTDTTLNGLVRTRICFKKKIQHVIHDAFILHIEEGRGISKNELIEEVDLKSM